MKYVRVMSDLHLEREVVKALWDHRLADDEERLDLVLSSLWQPKSLPHDKDTVLILAGDTWNTLKQLTLCAGDGEAWIHRVAKRFHSVIMVHGNHDYWGGDLVTLKRHCERILADSCPSNVHVLENSAVEIGGFRFLGGTMWTDFRKKDPLTMVRWPELMVPDSQIIRRDGFTLHAHDLYKEWEATYCFLLDMLRRPSNLKNIVVTHMAPLYESVHPRYRNVRDEPVNWYYCSDMSDLILDTKPWMWIHGHMHRSTVYPFGDTVVVVNAKGYLMHSKVTDTAGNIIDMKFYDDQESSDFDPMMTFDPYIRQQVYFGARND